MAKHRRGSIAGAFAWRLIEMIESPAHRALSLSARKILDRLEIELYRHGGKPEENGRLPCTYDHFVEFGVHRHAIGPGIREIVALGRHRPYDAQAVTRLAQSIKDVGLGYPITVIAKGSRFALVAGRHRLEAFRVLGEERIPATLVELSDLDARLWEISENLHRAELTVTQRSEQVAEYARLAEQKRETAKATQITPPQPQGKK